MTIQLSPFLLWISMKSAKTWESRSDFCRWQCRMNWRESKFQCLKSKVWNIFYERRFFKLFYLLCFTSWLRAVSRSHEELMYLIVRSNCSFWLARTWNFSLFCHALLRGLKPLWLSFSRDHYYYIMKFVTGSNSVTKPEVYVSWLNRDQNHTITVYYNLKDSTNKKVNSFFKYEGFNLP